MTAFLRYGVICILLSACSSSSTNEPVPGGGSGGISGGDSGLGATGGKGGGGGTGATGGVGATGGAAGDAGVNCDPNEKVGTGVFASPTGSDTTGDGTSDKPLLSIGQAVKLAATGPKVVYLDQGSYPESVSVSATLTGVTIRGGWKKVGTTWQRDCAPDARDKTVIDSPVNIGVKVDSVGLTLESLTVLTKAGGDSPGDAPGESVYGVFVTGDTATVALTDVRVAPGKGGAGGAVTKTSPGLTQTCDGLSNCQDGANGVPVSAGLDAAAGTFNASGYAPGDGFDGNPGNAGNNGTQGTIGTTVNGCNYQGCNGDCVTQCLDKGGNFPVKGDDGTCGCGGPGGISGGGGRGGGGSIALFVAGTAAVNVVASALAADVGGDGSAGLGGADGTAGTIGTNGTAHTCFGGCSKPGSCGSCLQASSQAAGGGKGGNGGKGGPGTAGGGGSGGPSIAVVKYGGAVVMLDAASQTTFTLGGKGSGNAPAGVAQADLTVTP